MHDTYWGLQAPVFTPCAGQKSLADSPVHQEALARLDFLCENRLPLGLLIGPPGSGKSTVLAAYADRANRQGAVVALANAAADERLVLDQLAISLHADADGDFALVWRRIADRFWEIQLDGLSAVILLDDLDRASPPVLSLVERLLAIGGDSLTIVVSAGQRTAHKIGPRLLDVSALCIDLAPWNETETRDYLATSLAKAGRQQPAFGEAASRRLFELSGGAPRKVNQLAQLALLAGAGQKLIQIDADTVEAVHEELAVAR
jgi:general secretion pathway protein A